MLETNTRDFTREMFKSAENRYENLNKKMQGSGFTLIM